MLDLHIIHTIANGINLYKSDRAKFDEVMNDMSPQLRDKYFQKLTNTQINFDRAFNQKHNKYPLITTKIIEKTSAEEQVLGNKGHRGKSVLLVNQNCDITIYDSDYDIMRILHRLIQATLLVFKGSFLQIGYLNLQFISSEELEPDDDATSDTVMIFKRVITFNATKQILATPPAAPDGLIPWVLNPPDIVNN